MNASDGKKNSDKSVPISNAGLKQRLASGFGAQGLQFTVRILEQIILVPFYLSAWGVDLYRDWLVLYATAALVMMLELGMQVYCSNTLRLAWSKGATTEFKRFLNVAGTAYLVVFSVGLFLIFFSLPIIDWPSVLNTHHLSGANSTWTLTILALANLAMIPKGLLGIIYQARGELARGIIMATLISLFTAIGTALALTAGAGLIGIAILILSLNVLLGWIWLVFDLRRRYPDLNFKPALPTAAEFRNLARNSTQYFMPQIGQPLIASGPIIILSHMGSAPAAVVVFSLTRTLSGLIRQFSSQLNTVSGIEMSRQYVQGNERGRRRLYRNTGRLIGGVVGILSGLLLVVAEPFIAVWTLGKVTYDPWLMLALLATLMLVSPSHPAFASLYHTNHPTPLIFSFLGHAAGGLLLCILLVPFLGPVGAAAGLGIAEFAMMGLFITILAGRKAGIRLMPYLGSTYGVGAISFVISFGIAQMALTLTTPDTVLGLTVFGLIWGSMIAIPTLFLLLTRDQRAWLLESCRGLLQRSNDS